MFHICLFFYLNIENPSNYAKLAQIRENMWLLDKGKDTENQKHMFSTANYTSMPNGGIKELQQGQIGWASRKIDFFWYSLFFILLLLLLLLDKLKKKIYFSIYHYMLWFMPMLWQFTYKMLWQISRDFFSEKSTDLLAMSFSGIF